MGKLYWHEVTEKEQLAIGDTVSCRNVGQWDKKGIVESIEIAENARFLSVKFAGDVLGTTCDWSTLLKWDEDDYITREYADYWIGLLNRCERGNPELDWSGNAEKIKYYESRVK